VRVAAFCRLSSASLCIMTYTLSAAAAPDPAVWIVQSAPGGAYAEAATAVETEIARAGAGRAEAAIGTWRELQARSPARPRLVVTVGSQALRTVLEHDQAGTSRSGAPVLAVLLPAAAYERLVEPGVDFGRMISAVLLDQPPERQIAALHLALPGRQRIGIIFGTESRWQEAAFQRAASEVGVLLVSGRVDSPDNLGGVLQRTLEDSDLLLTVADPGVFNNMTVQNILTSSYRRRLPVVGFSPACVNAGALLAIYSTPAQVGRQAGEIARAFLAGRPLPAVQHPRDFTIGINADVAASLGLPLRAEDGDALVRQLRMKEARP
jgi:putative tryptophan/tyrosine transport system substrate-binding protein